MDLQQQINNLFQKNTEQLIYLLDFRFYFAERVKLMSMMMDIYMKYADQSTFDGIESVVKEQKYIKARKLEPYIEKFTHFNKAPDILKEHIESTLLLPLHYHSYLAKLVRVTLRSFNSKFFQKLPK